MRSEFKAGFVLLLFGVAVGFVLAEVGLRLMYRAEEVSAAYWGPGAFAPHERAGYMHRPGFVGRAFRRGAFDSEVRIDDRGLREQGLRAELSRPRRVLFLGDSYTFGLGVSFADSFVGRLKAPLNRRGYGVINAGQTGYSVIQEVLFGTEWISETDPEWVVLSVFPTNDVEADHFRDFERIEVRHGVRLSTRRRFRDPISDYLRTHLYLWMYLDRRQNLWDAKVRRREFQELAEADPAGLLTETVTAIDDLRRDGVTSGFRLAVAIVPAPHGRSDPFDDGIVRVVGEMGLPLVDLRQAGLEPADQFESDGHWNERGHAKAAEAILAAMAPYWDQRQSDPSP